MGEPITKKRLEAYRGLYMTVEDYNDRIAQMKSEEQFPEIRAGDGSQHQPGTGDRLERAVIRRMEYEEKMAPSINAVRAEMKAIEDAVNAMDNPYERLVIQLRFLEGDGSFRLMKWRDVALRLYRDDDFKDLRAAQRLCDKALESITRQEKSHR